MSTKNKINIGLVGIGLDTYWPQFSGLKDKLLSYLGIFEKKIKLNDVNVINVGLIDNPEISREKGLLLHNNNVELIFLYISTYALSDTILPIAQIAKVPVIVLNMQPIPAINYEKFNAINDRGVMTGEWLANCQACSVPEVASVFNQARIPYSIISSHMEEDCGWEQIDKWVSAVKVCHHLKICRFGILGHYYSGMLDVYTNITQLAAVFGSHFEMLEMDDLAEKTEKIEDKLIDSKIKEFENFFLISPDCSEYELKRASKTACGLDSLVKDKKLDGIAYYYEGMPGNTHEDIITSVIPGNTVLTSKGTPISGECEVKNLVAMKILSLLGSGGSFSELYSIDYKDDIVMWGHDGPAHAQIAEGKVGLVPLPLYHGKPGKGLSIQMEVKNGPVTLLAVVQNVNNETTLLVAEGHAVSGPTLMIGNTNSRYRFLLSAREFVTEWSYQGPSHHCAIGVGHRAEELEYISKLLKINFVKIG